MVKRILLLLLLYAPALYSTAFFISPTGSDANTCVQAQSSSTPKLTFNSVFACMVAADTLNVMDGTYTAGTNGLIGMTNGAATNSYAAPSGAPPSGSSTAAMTIIQAVNPGSVTITGSNSATNNGNLSLGSSGTKVSFVKFIGFTFEAGNEEFYNTDHIFIKNCGFHSQTKTAGATLDIGTNDGDWGNTNLLFEDVWVWGQTRAMTIAFRSDHIVFRRVTQRQDGCDVASCSTSGNFMVGSTTYNSHHISWQNFISIDAILGSTGRAGAGDFQTAIHSSADSGHTASSFGANEWLGSMSLNSELDPFFMEVPEAVPGTAISPMFTVANVATITATTAAQNRGLFAIESSITIPSTSYNYVINGLTAKRGAGATQDMCRAASNFSVANSTSSVTNIACWGTGLNGISFPVVGTFTDTNGAGTNYGQATPTSSILVNPQSTSPVSIKFPTQVEAGSQLATAGSGGGILGATVLFKYGCDGCYYGDAGFDTVTANALWPWPNEATIKGAFCPSATRGLCTFTAANSQSSTFTRYVWEALGNATPAGVYPTTASGVSIIGGPKFSGGVAVR